MLVCWDEIFFIELRDDKFIDNLIIQPGINPCYRLNCLTFIKIPQPGMMNFYDQRKKVLSLKTFIAWLNRPYLLHL